MSVSVAFLRTADGPVEVTREKVLAAMREFDSRFRAGENESGTLYSVVEDGKVYPPKRILELATGIPRSKFYGGQPSNDVLRGLGFYIAAGEGGPGSAHDLARRAEPVPAVGKLLDDLFKTKWSKLDEDITGLVDSEYPGVYVLAYPHGNSRDDVTGPDLTGQTVSEHDIFYVGVSHAGVRKRLRQFVKGVDDNDHHSAAMRFFKEFGRGEKYRTFAHEKPFFVSSISIPSTSLKSVRTPRDLEKMGVLAQLEWYVLARVKAKTGHEPPLNKR